MGKATTPLVVSKDLVKRLQQLALASTQDEASYEEAKRRYQRATEQAYSSAAQFATVLYDFTLEFAATPKLIEDKLKDLGLQFKTTSSVFNHISRIAFNNLPDGGAKRTRITYYANLIEKAYQDGMTSKDFKKLVESGLRNAERRLFAEPPQRSSRVLKKARDIASAFISNERFELPGVVLTQEVTEGSDVQLLAEYRNGKLTVYGLIPPELSNTDTVLAKIAASVERPERHKHELLRDMLNVIKLVTKTKDETATASYIVKDSKFHFVVSAKRGTAGLTGSSDLDLFEANITLSVADWGRLLSTLIPLRKYITSIVASANDCVVTVDEREVPDIAAWMEQRKHAITFGKSSGSTMLFELKGSREALEEPTGRWETLGTISAQKIAQYLKFKPSKKFSTIEFAADGTLKFGSLARKADGQMHLTRPAYRQFRSACQKMKTWAPGLSFEKRKEQLRVSAAIGTDLSVFAYVGIE